jgi:hypothetical protein
VTKALCKELIDSIDPAYIAHLDNPFSGFNNVQVKNILLFAISARQLYSNEQMLAKPHAIVFNTGLYHDALEKWGYPLPEPTTTMFANI